MRHHGMPLLEIDPSVRDGLLVQYGFELVALEWD